MPSLLNDSQIDLNSDCNNNISLPKGFKKLITFKPFLGLANRMRAINSAVGLANHLNCNIKIVWVKDFKLNAWFTDLFQIPENHLIEIYQPSLSVYTLPFTYRFSVYMRFIRFLFNHKFDQSIIINRIADKFEPDSLDCKKRIFIASFREFYDAQFDSMLFKPKEDILKCIIQLSDSFDSSTYGIHIRRTDNPISIQSSPTELFENEIIRIIGSDNNAKFFLASDSEEEKKYFLTRFGDRIITSFFDTSRQSTEGIRNAVIDLYALSRTKMILGSYWSSFSDIAAAIGNIPLKIIKREN